MALPLREDVRRQSPFAWLSLAALAGVAAVFWWIDRRGAATGIPAAPAGCLALILLPRERMGFLPAPLRRLPGGFDCVPVLASLVCSPGCGPG